MLCPDKERFIYMLKTCDKRLKKFYDRMARKRENRHEKKVKFFTQSLATE